MKKKYKVGFTAGVYDMFHIGHLNLIKRAKEQCDYLIVGVNSDRLVEYYKNKSTVISESERREIVSNIRDVDKCVIMDNLDKIDAWEKFNFDVVFIGDDWKGSERWNKTEKELAKVNVKVEYLPYTGNISSTILRHNYSDKIGEENV